MYAPSPEPSPAIELVFTVTSVPSNCFPSSPMPKIESIHQIPRRISCLESSVITRLAAPSVRRLIDAGTVVCRPCAVDAVDAIV